MNKNELEYRHYKLIIDQDAETRSLLTDADGMVTGYAIVFDSESHDLGGFKEIVDPAALDATLANGHNIYALWEHDQRQAPVASTNSGTLKLTKDSKGLAIRLDPKRFTVAQEDAIRSGDMQMSFGFIAKVQDWLTNEAIPLRILRKIDLHEVSFVMSPAYPDTSAALRSLNAVEQTEVEAEENITSINTNEFDQEALALEIDILQSLNQID